MTDGGMLGIDLDSREIDRALVERFRILVLDDAPLSDDLVASGSSDAIAGALAAVVPEALERHRREGIPEPVTVQTLRDVGRKHCFYGAATVLPWLLGILRGDVVDVGRLQIERRPSAHGHALHIPEKGPLTPAAVDASLRRAMALTGATDFSCTSWLLDPRLSTHLPTSNIADFAARFRIVDARPADAEASADAAKFVFRRPLADVLDPEIVIPRSRLERLVAETLRSGQHWSEPTGTLSIAS